MQRHTRPVVAAFAVALCLGLAAHAQAVVNVANPNWNIDLTPFGYSDILLDNTPGFQGREYLSGEWAGAVTYDDIQTSQSITESAMWLEPGFIFPDWTTNSTFSVTSPIAHVGFNPQGFDIFSSTISNGDLSIKQTWQMIDTDVGIEMGLAPASAGGPGASITSDRYVLKHAYEITNTRGEAIENLKLSQMLHGLNSINSVYDDRNYGGPHDTFQYDTTQVAIDEFFGNLDGDDGDPDFGVAEEIVPIPPSDAVRFKDFIGFHSTVAPLAFDNDFYGKDSVDNHSVGKPSVGTHLNIEADALNGVDFFDPGAPGLPSGEFPGSGVDEFWSAGAQQYDLGTLGEGESAAFEVLLSIRTGTEVSEPGTTIGNGGTTANPNGGMDVTFGNLITPGTLFVDTLESEDDFSNAFPTVPTPPQEPQLAYNVTFTGETDEPIIIDIAVPTGIDLAKLIVWHFDGENRDDDGDGDVDEDLLDGIDNDSDLLIDEDTPEWYRAKVLNIDPVNRIVTIELQHLSPLVVVPEPATFALFGVAGLAMLRRRR